MAHLITVGEDGTVGADASGVWTVSSSAVDVVDTSGAGDVFCAALAVALDEGRSLRTAAEWACAVAALSVQKVGTIPVYPIRDDVTLFLAK